MIIVVKQYSTTDVPLFREHGTTPHSITQKYFFTTPCIPYNYGVKWGGRTEAYHRLLAKRFIMGVEVLHLVKYSV